jgi:hypothetical protein
MIVMMSAQPWEPRLGELEGVYKQVDKRLDALHADLRELRVEMASRFAAQDGRFNSIDSRFNQLTAVVVTGALAIIGTVVGLFESVIHITR